MITQRNSKGCFHNIYLKVIIPYPLDKCESFLLIFPYFLVLEIGKGEKDTMSDSEKNNEEHEKKPSTYFILDISGNKVTEFDAEEFGLIHKNSIKGYKEKIQREEDRKNDPRGDFIQFSLEPNKGLNDITVQQRRYLMELMPYVAYGELPLRYIDENGEIIHLNNQTIADIWGINKRDTIELLNKFVEKGFFIRKKDPHDGRKSNYIPTGFFFAKGKLKHTPNEYTTKIFQSKLVEIIQNIKKIEERKNRRKQSPKKQSAALGMIHAVLPYFHYQTYYLVKNPNENICKDGETVLEALTRNPKVLKHLPKAQLGRLSGIGNQQTVDYYFKVLMQAGAVMLQHTKGKTLYKIHPDLMFRMDGSGLDDYTEFVRQEFRQHD